MGFFLIYVEFFELAAEKHCGLLSLILIAETLISLLIIRESFRFCSHSSSSWPVRLKFGVQLCLIGWVFSSPTLQTQVRLNLVRLRNFAVVGIEADFLQNEADGGETERSFDHKHCWADLL